MSSSRKVLLVVVPFVIWFASGCSITINRYSDGPLTEYLSKPLPELNEPIARSLSLELVNYNTAASDKGRLIGDLVAREIFFFPSRVGRRVHSLLEMDAEFSEEATIKALNVLAESRFDARSASGGKRISSTSTSGLDSSTASYVRRQESMASQAYAKGDYLGGDIHNAAAASSVQINQAFSRAQASVDTAFSVMGAVQSVGVALIKSEYNTMRKWIEHSSGAIGPEALEGSHLSIFMLHYFDAKSFQLDSRMRIAAYLVHTDGRGQSIAVLEGSDILNCEGECNLFQPKPSAKLVEEASLSSDIHDVLWSPEGYKASKAKGFEPPGGPFQYILLKHGLLKLSSKLH